MKSGAEAVTKQTCADQGHFLGNSSHSNITVIDTPGFGDDIRWNVIHMTDFVISSFSIEMRDSMSKRW